MGNTPYYVGFLVGLVSGVIFALAVYSTDINSECKEFGKSYTSQYDLVCTKRGD